MAVVELHTFRLLDADGERRFLEADARAQTAFAYRQPGLLRRTTARSSDGEWLVVTLWASQHDAESADAAARADDAAQALHATIDSAGATVRRYHTLD
jgi:heme-degrading monooxygenase HmoA